MFLRTFLKSKMTNFHHKKKSLAHTHLKFPKNSFGVIKWLGVSTTWNLDGEPSRLIEYEPLFEKNKLMVYNPFEELIIWHLLMIGVIDHHQITLFELKLCYILLLYNINWICIMGELCNMLTSTVECGPRTINPFVHHHKQI